MITLRPSHERGHADHGWLDAYHTFSFASYHDPAHTRFGKLRVLNQDRVQPGQGFGTHGHENMEIVTWVLEGALQHEDSMGNGSVIRPGEAQYMSAGTGVTHSEFNASDSEPLHLLQMWVFPAVKDTEPRYEQKCFDDVELTGRMRLIVAPDGADGADGALTIGQDARLFAGTLAAGDAHEHAMDGRRTWVHVATGSVHVDDELLGPGDGAGVVDQPRVTITGVEPAQVVLWDLA